MRNIQASGNLYGVHTTLKQVSKTAARKLFAEGKTVYLQSSNMYPFGVWQQVCPIELDQDELKSAIEHANFCAKNSLPVPAYDATPSGQFDSRVQNYAWYNCDSERGKYVHFYQSI